MSDENLHKDVLKARKEYKREYMREYMRARRRNPQRYSSPRPQNLHGPVTPANLPRTESTKALLQAHYAHVLTLFSETGHELATASYQLAAANQELATLKRQIDTQLLQEELKLRQDEINAQREEVKNLREELKHLRDEVKTLREELKHLRAEVKNLREASKTQVLKVQEPLPPPLPTTTKPLEPGLVDPDRRPSPADDTPADWMML